MSFINNGVLTGLGYELITPARLTFEVPEGQGWALDADVEQGKAFVLSDNPDRGRDSFVDEITGLVGERAELLRRTAFLMGATAAVSETWPADFFRRNYLHAYLQRLLTELFLTHGLKVFNEICSFGELLGREPEEWGAIVRGARAVAVVARYYCKRGEGVYLPPVVDDLRGVDLLVVSAQGMVSCVQVKSAILSRRRGRADCYVDARWPPSWFDGHLREMARRVDVVARALRRVLGCVVIPVLALIRRPA